MTAPTATVLICTSNRAAVLGQTLDALSQVDRPGAWDVLVVDNASSDGTHRVVEDMIRRYPVPLRYLREDRRGKSFALNAGIAAAEGQFIAFTDDDAIPDRGWLKAIVNAFADLRADWVFGPVIPKWCGAAPEWFSETLNPMFALLNLGDSPFVASEMSHAFFGLNCAARREALLQLGPYRSDLGPVDALGGGGEDSDMFLRALKSHQKVMYIPSALVSHVIPEIRTTRGFHRRRILAGRRKTFKMITAESPNAPRLLGIPRYYYRTAIADFLGFLRATLQRRRPDAFWHELRLLRFAGMFEVAVKARITSQADLV